MAIIVIKKITVVSYILKTPNPIIKYPVSMERIAKIEIAISDMKAQERKLKLINQSARTGIIAAEKIANLDILLMEFYHVSFLLMSLNRRNGNERTYIQYAPQSKSFSDKKDETKSEKDDSIAFCWFWQQASGSFEPYDEETNLLIEKEYKLYNEGKRDCKFITQAITGLF